MVLGQLIQSWRSLAQPRHRSFALASVFTLALGIGAVTAIWSLVHAVLLAPLPYRAPDEVVRLAERNDSRELTDFAVSTPNFESWRTHADGLSGMAGLREMSANLTGAGQAERVSGMAASANFWDVAGLPLIAGRPFEVGEERSGGVAIVSEGLWRRRFGADPGLIGRTIRVDGADRTVVGIAPQDVGFSTATDLWIPLEPFPNSDDRGDRRLTVVGRLAPGATLVQVRAAMSAYAAQLEHEFPDTNTGWGVDIATARDWIVGSALRERLQLLFAAVLLILLVACTNVANLQIARAATRTRELGVRQALGASRGRLVFETSIESFALVLIGAVSGMGVAWLMLQGAVSLLPATTPRLATVSLDPLVAGMAAAASMLTALAFGLFPAFAAARSNPATALQRSGRTGSDVRRAGARRLLVVAQFALATMLAIGAAQLVQQMLHLQNTPLGYSPEHVITARIALPEIDNDEALTHNRAAYDALIDEVSALPGVAAASVTNEVPQGDFDTQMRVGLPGVEQTATEGIAQASWRIITAGYMQTMQIPVLAGRGFAAREESHESVLLSASLARRLWSDPAKGIGRWVHLENGQYRMVVGIVGDVRQRGVADELTPTMYFPTTWYLWSTMTLTVRANGDAMALAPALRTAAARAFPGQPLYDVRSMTDVVSSSIAAPRLQTLLLLAFAGTGLLLATLGVAGVVAYLVTQRTAELAVRMALGAAPRRVLRQVLMGGTALCAVGVSAGLLMALGLGRAMHSMMPGPDAQISLSVAASVAALLLAGVFATWLPARRVLRIAPSAALRGD